MTFLQLVQRLFKEAAMPGTTPTAVSGLSGNADRAVSWILSAYEDIQNLHHHWKFLTFDFSFTTTAATQTYTKAAVSLTELASWVIDDRDPIRIYSSESDESELVYMPWHDFRATYLFGTYRSESRRPEAFSVNNSESMVLGPIPDDTYTVNGQYRKRAQTMSATDDEPLIPQQYQMIIVWRALMMYAAYEEAQAVYDHGDNEYTRLLAKLELNQLPDMTWGNPLGG